MSASDTSQRACPVCGAPVNVGDRFCPSCGTPQEWPEPAAPRPTEPGSPPAEPDPWLVDTRPTPTVPSYQTGTDPGAPFSQAAWTPPPPPQRNKRTWWVLGGIFLFLILVCCCCALLVFFSASQDTALREDLEGTVKLLLALRAAI